MKLIVLSEKLRGEKEIDISTIVKVFMYNNRCYVKQNDAWNISTFFFHTGIVNSKKNAPYHP